MRYFIFISLIFCFSFWTPQVNGALFDLPKVDGLSAAGRQLVYDFEVGGGEPYYNKFLQRISWPGAASGATGGIGYDFAYSSPQNIRKDWVNLPDSYLNRLVTASGKTGLSGKIKAKELNDILIKWKLAEEVFDNVTVARYWQLCERTWPGFNELDENVQSVLWSLTYNRGGSLAGPSRIEMREIARLTPKKDYKGIAIQIKKMKRLWEGKGMQGLLDRRDA
ncbi:MAG: hypothetical protein M0P71_16910, partial [Melioribacteraceae bacterium]|nr:hypothetical protein [Melioribacteraceae bacterium]